MDDNSTGRVVCDIAVSVDGYVAGPNQTEEKVFGDGPVEELHAWFEDEENADLVDQIVAAGAYVMGRNMFGPIRGEWEGDWRGWWGEDPPYHGPVFVLTHHPRDPVPMEGGTTFTFVTDGIESALEQARTAAGDRDVAIAGGAATVNQYLAAGLLDELRLHVAPVVLGAGERLFEGVSGRTLELVAVRPARRVTHITYRIGKVTAPAG
jgi:dihydrofolate reductase